ncbi:MAG TPA: hypothetical protein VMZ04_06425, partial [Anaerolineae bacterium]|nr:hypothetical protein [Anaerolineae bacterium]
KMNNWYVTLLNKSVEGTSIMSLYYSMGTGIVEKRKSIYSSEWRRGSLPFNRPKTIQDEEDRKHLYRPAQPTVSDVLNCLASDASGIENARDFNEWASEYGYDEDSREAERIYKVCQDQANQLQAFLPDEKYNELLFEVEPE